MYNAKRPAVSELVGNTLAIEQLVGVFVVRLLATGGHLLAPVTLRQPMFPAIRTRTVATLSNNLGNAIEALRNVALGGGLLEGRRCRCRWLRDASLGVVRDVVIIVHVLAITRKTSWFCSIAEDPLPRQYATALAKQMFVLLRTRTGCLVC